MNEIASLHKSGSQQWFSHKQWKYKVSLVRGRASKSGKVTQARKCKILK